jgi:sulfoxide reductase heme-binding subunit YedZ
MSPSTWRDTPSPKALRALRAGVFALACLPFLRLVLFGLTDRLGVNPIEFVTRSTGTWTLVLLLVTLAVTPLRRLAGLPWLIRLRRMLGLFAFFYGSLHLATYLWLDQFFDVAAIVKDVLKRPFITVGFAAWSLMLPLAMTSTHGWVRRLGGRNWQRLHYAVYAIAVLGVTHYWWLVKKDITDPVRYAAVLALLLGYRLYWRLRVP